MEKLFYQYGVDLALWAHEHSYERLWPVYDRKVSGGWKGERSCSISMAWPRPSGPMNTLWTTVAYDRKVSGGGGKRLFYQYGVGLALWPMNTPINDCGLCMPERWVDRVFWGEGGRGWGGAGGEAVLSVWHGHGPLGPWILLWTTVACLWQKGEWTVGVEEGGVGVRFCQYGVDLAL